MKQTNKKQMWPSWTQKLLHSKENHKQNEKKTHRMEENICKVNDKRLNSKITQAAHAALCKNQRTQSKNGWKI